MARDVSPPEAPIRSDAWYGDVDAQRLAAVYAEAFLKAGENAKLTPQLVEEFDAFISEVLDALPKLERILASLLVSPEEKSRLLDRAIGSQASRLFLNFLKVVSRHGRMELLRAIHRQVHEQWDRLRGHVPVEIATAAPLDEATFRRVETGIGRILGGALKIRPVVDPALIGGLVVRVGDVVYDASVANQLRILREQMIERSAHEIQSRRDRFRSPEGD